MYFNKNSSKIIEALHESAGSYKITGKTLKEFYQNLEKEGYKLDKKDDM